MHLKNKIPADTTGGDIAFMEAAPKTVLFAIAKHLAALAHPNGYDSALTSGGYINRMHQEWSNLHAAGVLPQKPPKVERIKG
jgi:hypothetical protein